MYFFSRLTLAQRLVAAALAVGGVLAVTLLVYLAQARASAVEASGLAAGRAVSSQIVTLRTFYTKEIASRAKKAGMQLGHDFFEKDNMLPLPATLVKTLGETSRWLSTLRNMIRFEAPWVTVTFGFLRNCARIRM